MITVRKSGERGHFDFGWLKTYHTFSFGDYDDPAHRGFRALRVINEDFVSPGKGFGTHPHRDMEIVTYILEGALSHQDSMGNGSVIRPGDVQRMSAGTGVTHSEFNHSQKESVHLLQIWIFPERKGILPGYEQKAFPDEEKRGRLRLVASRDGRDGSVALNQDVALYAGLLGQDEKAVYPMPQGRSGWIQVARGSVLLNQELLHAGDGAAVTGEKRLEVVGKKDAELLLFDLS